MSYLSKEELLKQYGNLPWVSPYSRVVAMTDGEFVELHEFHARERCYGGASWEVLHYPRVSELVINARREGARNVFVLKPGKTELKLIPGIAGAGIEEVKLTDRIEITYAGLAGGGVAATVCRGLAEDVDGIEILELGGGAKLGKAKIRLKKYSKVVIGVDDTDNKEKGATWALVNELAFKLEKAGYGHYLMHTITQLYTKNPAKTTNCVSVSVTFATEKPEELVNAFRKGLERTTLSDNTAMVVFRKILIPEKLISYGEKVKSQLVELEEAKRIAEELGIETFVITGERGVIGAVAALAFSNSPEDAVKIYA
jgi:methanogenesis imperfect marker protein 11